jgi:hypothetical protein
MIFMDKRCAYAIAMRALLIGLSFDPDDVYLEVTRRAQDGRLHLMTTVHGNSGDGATEYLFAADAGIVEETEDAHLLIENAKTAWNESPPGARVELLRAVGIDNVGLVATLTMKGLRPWMTKQTSPV